MNKTLKKWLIGVGITLVTLSSLLLVFFWLFNQWATYGSYSNYVEVKNCEGIVRHTSTYSYSRIECIIMPEKKILTLFEGSHNIKMIPSVSQVNLPSGATLQFGRIGRADAVPDFIFDEAYSNEFSQEINHLPILDRLSTYHRGYTYNIVNEGCKIVPLLNTDVINAMTVEHCNVSIEISESDLPDIKTTDLTYKILANERAPFASVNEASKQPLLYIKSSPVTLFVWGGIPNINSCRACTWNMQVITHYGVSTISYTPKELVDMITKSVKIGQSKVEIVIDSVRIDKIDKAKIGMTLNYRYIGGEDVDGLILEYDESSKFVR